MNWRHMLTALAAHLPCRVEPAAQPVPSFACDCQQQAADRIRVWNEGVQRAFNRAGIFFSPSTGTC